MDAWFDMRRVNHFSLNEGLGIGKEYSYLWIMSDYTPFIGHKAMNLESSQFQDSFNLGIWKLGLDVYPRQHGFGPRLILIHSAHTTVVAKLGYPNLLISLDFVDNKDEIFNPAQVEQGEGARTQINRLWDIGVGEAASRRIAYDIRPHMGSLLCNGNLRILLRMWNLGLNTKSGKWDEASQELYGSNKPPSTVMQSLATLFRDGHFSDVNIRVGQETFPANKCILAARSDVFGAMFSSEMQESITGEVEINGFSFEVVHGMLEWIYTDKAEIRMEEASSYLAIADMYNLDGLKYEAEFALCKSLNTENVFEYFQYSIDYKAPMLELALSAFATKNKRSLLSDPAFEALPDSAKLAFKDLLN